MTRLADTARARAGAPAGEQADAIGAWLDRLLRITGLPIRENGEIRDELEEHLRERVRDLMLAGHDEPDAIHKSISELGDLALLAQRYRDAHQKPKGRLIVNIAIVSAACAALGLSSFAVQQSQKESPLAPAGAAAGGGSGPAGAGAGVPVLSGIPLVGNLFSEPGRQEELLSASAEGQPLRDVLFLLAEPSGSRMYVYWNELSNLGLDAETEIDFMPFEGQTVEKALSMLSDSLAIEPSRLEHRVENGLMEVATRDFFDRREVELVSYDAGALLAASTALEQTGESEALVQLITQLIEPDVWDTGGGFATVSAVGNRLFVNAPSRVHQRVRWLLAELASADEHAARLDAVTGFVADALVAADPRASSSPVGLSEVLDRASGSFAVADLPPESDHAVRDAVSRATAEAQTTVYGLAFVDAGEALPIVRAAIEGLGGSVEHQARGNGLVVRGGRKAQETASSLLRVLDRPAEDIRTPLDRVEGGTPAGGAIAPPMTLRLIARDGRAVAQITDASGSVSTLEAAQIELTGVDLRALRASDAAPSAHVVSEGDSLFSIAAERLGDALRWREILGANPGLRGDRLAVGAEIALPVEAAGAGGR